MGKVPRIDHTTAKKANVISTKKVINPRRAVENMKNLGTMVTHNIVKVKIKIGVILAPLTPLIIGGAQLKMKWLRALEIAMVG
jgi:hypothetical protein